MWGFLRESDEVLRNHLECALSVDAGECGVGFGQQFFTAEQLVGVFKSDSGGA